MFKVGDIVTPKDKYKNHIFLTPKINKVYTIERISMSDRKQIIKIGPYWFWASYFNLYIPSIQDQILSGEIWNDRDTRHRNTSKTNSG